MTIIRAHCPCCGGVDLTADQVLLIGSPCGVYAFTCPVCGRYVAKPADTHTAAVLTAAGVLTVREDIPAEARELHTGPAISADDVLDFVLGDLSMRELVA